MAREGNKANGGGHLDFEQKVADLERLAKLLESGHISREEYEAQKRRLLDAE